MRGVFPTVAAIVFSLSLSATAATIDEDPVPVPAPLGPSESSGPGASSNAPGVGGDQSRPVVAAPRPPKGPSRLDVDGNGLSDGLEAQLANLGPNAPVDVIVTFSGPGNAASARAAVGNFSVTHEYTLIPGFAATMRAAQARALAQVPGVFRVELDGTVHGYLGLARSAFGVDSLDGMPAFPVDPTTQKRIDGEGVVICVVDSGIWPFHAQFADATGALTKVEKFRDFIGDDQLGTVSGELAHDEHWHGTAVAAVAAGDGTPLDEGLEGDPPLAFSLRGVATGATLWSAQVLEPDLATGGATGSDAGVIAGVNWCVTEAQAEFADPNSEPNLNMVINLSLGSPGLGCQGDALAQAVDAAKAAGAVVVVAAGNSGDGDTIGTPACAPGAFAVAAAADHTPAATPELSAAESLGRYVAPWSSRGAGLLGGATGPGVTMLSAFNTTTVFAFSGCDNTLRGCYIMADGTSFASPFVAGIAAGILEADPSLTPDQVYQILRDTAKPWGPGGSPNEVAGSGMVDGQAAVQEALGGMACIEYTPSVSPAYSITTSGVANNGSIQFPIWVVDPSLPLAITMSIDGNVSGFGIWDPDLDMTLLDANGAPYEIEILPGWTLPVPGTTSTCPAGEDCGLVGAQETIHVALPVAGEVIVPGSVAPHYFLEVYAWDGFPNNGQGGPFTLEFSNAYSDTFGPEAGPCDDGPPVPATIAYASSENTSFGTVTGSYMDTHDMLPGEEIITETESKGRKKTSRLDHTWQVDGVAGGASVMLHVNAYALPNSGEDNFEFDVSTNAGQAAFTLVGGNDEVRVVELPAGTFGTVFVRVRDSNRSKGANTLDSVSVRQLYIESNGEVALTAPGNLTATPSESDIQLTWTHGTGHDTYDVEESDGFDGWLGVVAGLSPTTDNYTHGSLTDGSTHTYRVCGVDAMDSVCSGSATATVGAQLPVLTASGYKVKGVQHASLSWTGLSSSPVAIYRDGSLTPIDTVGIGTSSYDDNIDQKGGGYSYVYRVCEADDGMTNCSNTDTVNF